MGNQGEDIQLVSGMATVLTGLSLGLGLDHSLPFSDLCSNVCSANVPPVEIVVVLL